MSDEVFSALEDFVVVVFRRRIFVLLLFGFDLLVHFFQLAGEEIQLFVVVDLDHRRVRLHALEKFLDQTLDVARLTNQMFQFGIVQQTVDEFQTVTMDFALFREIQDRVVAQVRFENGNQTRRVDDFHQAIVEQVFGQLVREDRMENVEEIDDVFFVQFLNLENFFRFPLAVRRAGAEAGAFGPEIGVGRRMGRRRAAGSPVARRVQLLNGRFDVFDVVLIILVVVIVEHRIVLIARRRRRCCCCRGRFSAG